MHIQGVKLGFKLTRRDKARGGRLVLLMKSLLRMTLLKGASERRDRNLYNYNTTTIMHWYKIKATNRHLMQSALEMYILKLLKFRYGSYLDQEPQVNILTFGLLPVNLTVLVVSDVNSL